MIPVSKPRVNAYSGKTCVLNTGPLDRIPGAYQTNGAVDVSDHGVVQRLSQGRRIPGKVNVCNEGDAGNTGSCIVAS